MAKILVTGEAGFMGSHAVELFVHHTYLSVEQPKKDLGWAATIKLEEGLRGTVEYSKTWEKVI